MRKVWLLGFALVACDGSATRDLPATCTADLDSDPNNCGACGHVCLHQPGAVSICQLGACSFRCEQGRDDCNRDPNDGCEVELASDPFHCGECGARCEVESGAVNLGAVCSDSTCGVRCESGFGDCNANLGDGCEIDLSTDDAHCGFCLNACTAGCSAGTCAGEVPPCKFFEAEAPRVIDVVVAGDGETFVIAWTDFDNEGLWIAALDRSGRPAGSALRVADMESWWRFGLAYDGAAFVLAWEDETLMQVRAQKFSSEAAPLGDAVILAEGSDPNRITIAGGSGALISIDSSIVSWRTGALAPDPVVSIPSSVTLGPKGVHVRDGWLIFWGVEKPGSFNIGLHWAFLDAQGVFVRAPAELDGTVTLGPSHLYTVDVSGDGALLAVTASHTVGVGGLPFLWTLAFDGAGAPATSGGGALDWQQPFQDQLIRSAGLAGDATGAWLAAVPDASDTALFLRRLDHRGVATALSAEADTRPGFYGTLTTASNADGAFMAWPWRSFAGGPDLNALEGSFVTHAGMIARPCD